MTTTHLCTETERHQVELDDKLELTVYDKQTDIFDVALNLTEKQVLDLAMKCLYVLWIRDSETVEKILESGKLLDYINERKNHES